MKDSLTKLFGSHLVNLDMLPDCPVIIDVGACVGNFMKDIQKHIKRPRFYAIEPNKNNVEELRTMAFKQAFPQQITITEAVLVGVKEPDRIIFYEIQGLPEWGNVTGLYTARWHKSHIVKTISLEKLLEQIPGNTIHYMKMDIEGSEWDVVNDMNEETAKRIQQISMEIHSHPLAPPTVIVDKLENLGYDVMFKEGELYAVRIDINRLVSKINICEDLLKHATDLVDKMDETEETRWVQAATNEYFREN